MLRFMAVFIPCHYCNIRSNAISYASFRSPTNPQLSKSTILMPVSPVPETPRRRNVGADFVTLVDSQSQRRVNDFKPGRLFCPFHP